MRKKSPETFLSDRQQQPSFYQPSAVIYLSQLLYNRKILACGFIFSCFLIFAVSLLITIQMIRKAKREEALQAGVKVDFIVRKQPIPSRSFGGTAYQVKIRRKKKRVLIGRVPSYSSRPDIGEPGDVSGYSDGFVGKLTEIPTLEEFLRGIEIMGRSLDDGVAFGPDLTPPPTKEPVNTFHFQDELTIMEDLDFGRYNSMVFPDPEDKTNLKGFIYIKT